MRVVHISTTDGGGGQNSVYRLHCGLRSLGHDSMMFVSDQHGTEEDSSVKVFAPPGDLVSRIRRRIRRGLIHRDRERYRSSRPPRSEFFSDDRSLHGRDVLHQLPECDVVNFHSTYGFIDYRAVLPTIARNTPIVRTLHDMAFFTGGCHVHLGCGKFADRCGACPQLGSAVSDDLSRQIWLRKASAFRHVAADRLHLVAPSRWLAGEAQRSSLASHFPVTVIPHGVDTDVFRPVNRDLARDVLGMSRDARSVLFVAEGLHRPVKGLAVLVQTLNGMRDKTDLLLITVGSRHGRPPVEVRVPHLGLGPIRDERFLSLVYSAVDILVIPSLQENCPLVVLVAMACGIPIVGSDVGGIPELVRPECTGLLVPPKDPDALRTAIAQLLDDPTRRAELGRTCRRIAVEEYPLTLQIRRYADLYEAILSGRGSAIATFNGDGGQVRLPSRTPTAAHSARTPQC